LIRSSVISEKSFLLVDNSRGVNLVGKGGGDDRLLSGPDFLLAKLAALKHLTQ